VHVPSPRRAGTEGTRECGPRPGGWGSLTIRDAATPRITLMLVLWALVAGGSCFSRL